MVQGTKAKPEEVVKLLEGREQGRGKLKHADDVGLNDRPHHGNIDGIGSQVFGTGDSGIVDEDVERRELFLNTGRQGIEGERVFNDVLHAMHARMGGSDLIEEMLTTASDDDLIAQAMESLGKGAPNTAGTAGDEDGVASEIHGSFLLQDVLRIVRAGP